MPHEHGPNCAHADDEHLTRIDILKQAFGEHAQAFEDNLDEQAKAHFEAYKFKVAAQKPVYAARASLAQKIPQFWTQSLANCRNIAQFVDPVDEDAMQHLTNVEIVHDEKDVREFEVKFTFSAKNPYFKETTLSKKLTLTPPSSVTDAPPPPSSFDLDAPLYLAAPTTITWTSPDHDLTKKAPRGAHPDESEDFDDFAGPGSLFNWFGEEGEDKTSLGESLLEWYSHASEYAAGLASLDDASDDDGDDQFDGLDFDDLEDDDDESEDDDPKKEIDLDDEESKRPKKKVKSRK
ncbi:hypothetical protein JCM6882_004571 [Rhodosporidiobolus microsporus]